MLVTSFKGGSYGNGIVNLFALMQYQGEGEASHFFLPSGGQGRDRDLPPHLESFSHLLTICRGGKPMTARAKVLRDRAIRGEETLGLPGGLKPLHAPFPLTRRLMRVLRTVV
jgi:hypothetical protein